MPTAWFCSAHAGALPGEFESIRGQLATASSAPLRGSITIADAAFALHKELGAQGIGTMYWFNNMYHYIKQWDHIKDLRMPYKLVAHELGLPQDLKTLKFPKSDAVISRLVSFNIRVTWTEAELDAFIGKVEAAVKKVMEGVVA